jgi:hypothetical protein
VSSTQSFNAEDLRQAPWRKSSHSGNGDSGSCVEVAPLDGHVAVRHSRHAEGPVIIYTLAEWRAFMAGAHGAEFDF